MDFELPEDLRMLKDTVRKFVERELIPIEMQAMDGPDQAGRARVRSSARRKTSGFGCSMFPKNTAGWALAI